MKIARKLVCEALVRRGWWEGRKFLTRSNAQRGGEVVGNCEPTWVLLVHRNRQTLRQQGERMQAQSVRTQQELLMSASETEACNC